MPHPSTQKIQSLPDGGINEAGGGKRRKETGSSHFLNPSARSLHNMRKRNWI
jgi:hypothetical protein